MFGFFSTIRKQDWENNKEGFILQAYINSYISGDAVQNKALEATAIHRGSSEQIVDKTGIIEKLSASEELIHMWEKYRKKFSYASEIQYADVMDVLIKMFQ